MNKFINFFSQLDKSIFGTMIQLYDM